MKKRITALVLVFILGLGSVTSVFASDSVVVSSLPISSTSGNEAASVAESKPESEAKEEKTSSSSEVKSAASESQSSSSVASAASEATEKVAKTGGAIAASAATPQNEVDFSYGYKAVQVPNGSFETDDSENTLNNYGLADWTQWSPAGGVYKTKLDAENYTEGSRSLHLESSALSLREGLTLSLSAEAGRAYILSADIKLDNMVGDPAQIALNKNTGFLFRAQYRPEEGQAALDNNFAQEFIRGTQDWTTHHLYQVVPERTDNILAVVMIQWATGKSWVDNIRLHETYIPNINGYTAPIKQNGSVQLSLGSNWDSESFVVPDATWSSSAPGVATVNAKGQVTGVAPGSATITADIDEYHSAEITVVVTEQQQETAVNLAPNGSFEKAQAGAALGVANWTNWNAGTNKTAWSYALDKSVFTDGLQALRLTSTDFAVRLGPAMQTPIEAGKSYIVSIDMKTENIVKDPAKASSGVVFRAMPKDGGGQKTMDPFPVTEYVTGTTGWTTYQLGLTAPENTVSLSSEIFLDWCTGTAWFDNVRVEETYTLSITGKPEGYIEAGDSFTLGLDNDKGEELPAATWRSSDTGVVTVDAASGKVTAVGVGTAVISAATDELHKTEIEITVDKLEPPAVNFAPNGSFEIAQAGTAFGVKDWSNWNRTSGTWSSVLDTSAGNFTDGAKSLRITGNSTTCIWPSHVMPAQAGKTYIVSVDIKTEDLALATTGTERTPTVSFRPQMKNDANTSLVNAPNPISLGTNGWTTYKTSITAPAGTTKLSVEFLLDYFTGKIWFDNVRVEETYTLSITGEPEATVDPGDTVKLGLKNSYGITVLPAATWSSSDETIATVDPATGIVTAVAEGTVEITAKVDDLHETSIEIVVGEYIPPRYANLASNPGFEEPLEPVTDAEGAGTNYKLWPDDVKAPNWIFQRYSYPTYTVVPTSYLQASVDSTTAKEGDNSAKLQVFTADKPSQQAFFKQGSIKVEPSTFSKFSFWYKSQGLVGGAAPISVRVELYNDKNVMETRLVAANLSPGTVSDWTQCEVEFTTSATTTHVMVIIVFNNNATGTLWVDDVWVGQPFVPMETISFPQDEYELLVGASQKLTAITAPETASDKTLVWESSDEDVATVDQNGVVTAVNEGPAEITVSSFADPDVKTSVKVDVVSSIFRIDNGDMTLRLGEKRYLDYTDSEMQEDETNVTWVSSNEDVAVIQDDGLLVSTGVGSCDVTLTSQDGKRTATAAVTVTEDDGVEFTMMKERWLTRIVGGEDLDASDEEIGRYVDNLSNTADTLWENLNKEEDRTRLWPLVSGNTISADYTTQFTRLRSLALSFATKGSSLYGKREVYEEVVRGIEFMTTTMNYNGTYVAVNWWDWQIGCGQALTDILMILDEYVEDDFTKKYTNILEKYVPAPSKQLWISGTSIGGWNTSVSANRTDLALPVLGSGILARDKNRINLVPAECNSVLDIKANTTLYADGFYQDGSFIQHGYLAYSGSYGNELLKGVGRLNTILEGSAYVLNEQKLEEFYVAVLKGYMPLLYNGRMASAVNGRSITRYQPYGQELSGGNGTLANLLILAKSASPEFKEKIYQAAKYVMELNTELGSFDYYERARDIEVLLLYKDILGDESIAGEKPFTGAHVYGKMDRVAQSTNDYGIVLSMYSNRVANFESFHYENLNGWHTGSGMLYVYNTDYDQFGIGYWPTVDAYRLPGTTVDTRPISNTGERATGETKRSAQSWVGGSTDGSVAAAGMQYDVNHLGGAYGNLQAKKSWFMLDGAIVSLGADINGSTSASIETVVDNRQLTNGGNNTVLVNGAVYAGGLQNTTANEGDWIHIEGTYADSGMGYVFPQAAPLRLEKETSTGSYKQISSTQTNDTLFTEHYMKVSVNHGQNVEDGSYYYITLPGKNAQQTKAYAKNNPITVLQNDADAQAIFDASSNIFAMNVWNATGVSVGGYTTNGHASMVVRNEGATRKVSVSDPTQSGRTITLTLDETIKEVVSKSGSINVEADNKTITINTAGTGGGSLAIEYTVEAPLEGVEITESELKIVEKLEAQLTAVYVPEYADTPPAFVWESSDTNVATVSATGLVTAVAPGETTIKASAGGFEDTCVVTVVAKTLTGITLESGPNKTSYLEGDELSLAGLVVTANYDNNTTKDVTEDCSLSGYNANKPGEQTITVSYGGKTETFSVTVAAKTLTGISVTGAPSKVVYKQGEALDLSGLVISAQFDNGVAQTVKDYTISGFDPVKVGKQTVTVSYGGKTVTFTVTVEAAVSSSSSTAPSPASSSSQAASQGGGQGTSSSSSRSQSSGASSSSSSSSSSAATSSSASSAPEEESSSADSAISITDSEVPGGDINEKGLPVWAVALIAAAVIAAAAIIILLLRRKKSNQDND